MSENHPIWKKGPIVPEISLLGRAFEQLVDNFHDMVCLRIGYPRIAWLIIFFSHTHITTYPLLMTVKSLYFSWLHPIS